MKRLTVIAAVFVALGTPVLAQLAPLTDAQIEDAIALGKKGHVPGALAGRFLGISKGDFDVVILGPMGRIADAASGAAKELRPFTRADVTPEMTAPVYQVFIHHTQGGAWAYPEHIVLMPRGSKNLDDAIQPVRDSLRQSSDAYFDRLPDGEFDVVIATSKGMQRYNVTMKDRQKIQ